MIEKLRAHSTLLLAIYGLAVVNILLSRLHPQDGVDLAGHVVEHNSTQMIGATLKTLLIFVQVLGFGVGTIIALFPYKRQTYSEKYIRSSLLGALLLQSAIFIAGLINVVRWL